MKDLLLIRSVGIQQLDRVLPAVRAAFPEHRGHLLTHPHAQALVAHFQGIHAVHPYPRPGPFSFWHARGIPAQAFDVVLVPVSNTSGAGFTNVLLFSLAVKGRKRVLCNLALEFQPLSRAKILRRVGRELFISGVARVVSWPIRVLIRLFLPWMLRRLERT